MEFAIAVLLGLVIGAVVGTVGGGGAILALPVLVYVLGEGVSSGSTASLIVVTLGASVGAAAQARHGHVCWRIAAAFAPSAALGAYLGTVANTAVSPRLLILAFVPVMLAAAAVAALRAGETGGVDRAPERCPEPDLPRSGASGLLVGALTGFFGVGGGFIIVPALTSVLGLPIRRAIATSLAIIGMTGAVALVIHLGRGAQPDWPLTAVLCVAAAVGSLWGTSIGRRLSPTALGRAFGAVVATIAVFLLIDVLALGGPPSG
jgi:uncharacterized protein